MANRHASYNHEYGLVLHENGLNLVSRALRLRRPEMFAKSTTISIKPPTAEDPGHQLVLYAMVNEPISFDLSPVAGNPGDDRFKLLADLSFSLTDSQLGFITRMGIRMEAAGIFRRTDTISIQLTSFKVLELRGEHPDFASSIVNGKIDSGVEIRRVFQLDTVADGNLKETFVAIVNYLIDVFLEDAIKKPVVEFPVPDLSKLIRLGRLSFPKEELHGPFIRNNAFYVTLGRTLLPGGSFPDPGAGDPHITVGVTEQGVDRVIGALLPMPIDDLTKETDAFYLRSDGLHIHKININLRPGEEQMFARVFVKGLITIRVQFKVPVINKHVKFNIPLPLDGLSHYGGLVTPVLSVGDFNADPGALVRLHMVPNTRFLELWYAAIVTDYRNYLADVFRREINKISDSLIMKFFKKIPILGWILSKVVDMVGWAIGYVTGFVLDVFMSSGLTLLVNTIGRAVLQIMDRQEIDIVSFAQKDIYDAMAVSIRRGTVGCLEDGKGGELNLKLWFDGVPMPVRPPHTQPQPVEEQQLPQMQEKGPLPDQPEYTPGEFLPSVQMPGITSWNRNQRFRVQGTVEGGQFEGNISISLFESGNARVIEKSISAAGTGFTESTTIRYDKATGIATGIAQTSTMGQDMVFQYTGTVSGNGKSLEVRTFQNGTGMASDTVGLRYAMTEFADLWLYKLAYADPAAGTTGKFARVDLANPYEFNNWVREVPVTIVSVTEAAVPLPDGSEDLVRTIIASDEEGRYEIKTSSVLNGISSIRFTSGATVIAMEAIS